MQGALVRIERLVERRQEEPSVGVVEEDRLPIVPALDEVMRVAGDNETVRARHRRGPSERAATVAAERQVVK